MGLANARKAVIVLYLIDMHRVVSLLNFYNTLNHQGIKMDLDHCIPSSNVVTETVSLKGPWATVTADTLQL